MISIARKTLRYEWKRYLAAVLALAFSGLLLLVQIGLLFGMFESFTLLLDRGRADLWVTSAGVEDFAGSTFVPRRVEGRFWVHPDVVDVRPLYTGGGEWRRGTTKAQVFLFALGPDPNTVTTPDGFTPAILRALSEPGGVVVSTSDLGRLGARLGDRAEINKKRVRITAAVDGYGAAFGSYVFVSPATLRLLLGAPAENPPYYLIRLSRGADPAQVRRDLQPTGERREFDVWLPAELSRVSHMHWLATSGSGATFGFSAILALIIGVGVTSQSLRAAILGSLKEYAALRALGVSVRALRSVVLEQAAWVGAAGLAATILFALCAYVACALAAIAISFPFWLVVSVGGFLLAIASVSGLISLRTLYRSQPADLLR